MFFASVAFLDGAPRAARALPYLQRSPRTETLGSAGAPEARQERAAPGVRVHARATGLDALRHSAVALDRSRFSGP